MDTIVSDIVLMVTIIVLAILLAYIISVYDRLIIKYELLLDDFKQCEEYNLDLIDQCNEMRDRLPKLSDEVIDAEIDDCACDPIANVSGDGGYTGVLTDVAGHTWKFHNGLLTRDHCNMSGTIPAGFTGTIVCDSEEWEFLAGHMIERRVTP